LLSQWCGAHPLFWKNIADLEHPGQIQRLTFPKSHSKQGFHDARKAQWGDIFPFAPKGKAIERTRGVRRLNKVQPEPEPDAEAVMDELLGRTDVGAKQKGKGKNKRVTRTDATLPLSAGMLDEGLYEEHDGMEEMEHEGVEGIEREDLEVDGGDEVLVWRSGGPLMISRGEQRRSMSSIARTVPTQYG